MPKKAPVIDIGSHSPSNVREDYRAQLNADVEAFLQSGGKVEKIEKDVRADPPKKPTMNYGSAPI